jgi:hypothetical protein
MSWDTDWSTGVSETITEIQSIASNQITDEANIAALQAAAPYAASTTGATLSVSSSGQGRFLKVFAVGTVSSGAAVQATLDGGTVVISGFPSQSGKFILEFTLYFDGSNIYTLKAGGSNPQIGSSSSTSFNIVLSGTSLSVGKFSVAEV